RSVLPSIRRGVRAGSILSTVESWIVRPRSIKRNSSMSGEQVYRAPLHRRLRPLYFLSPTLLILLSVTLFPLIYSLYLATHTVILTNPMLSGWSLQDNLREVFLESPEYWESFATTLILVVTVVSIEFVLGLMLAYFFYNN